MVAKAVVIITMLIILAALGSSFFYLITDKGHSQKCVKALTWRISLSLSLFLFLLIGHYLGYLHANG